MELFSLEGWVINVHVHDCVQVSILLVSVLPITFSHVHVHVGTYSNICQEMPEIEMPEIEMPEIERPRCEGLKVYMYNVHVHVRSHLLVWSRSFSCYVGRI